MKYEKLLIFFFGKGFLLNFSLKGIGSKINLFVIDLLKHSLQFFELLKEFLGVI